LQQLTDAYPLREHPYELLMPTLYRDGRQAEPLAAYQDARQALIGEH
jgi:DNA-binding SARP family transcriptional activator